VKPAGGNFRWLLLSLAALAADQASKLAMEQLTPEGYYKPVIPGFLNLVHTHNPGVAFSLLADSGSPWVTVLLVVFSLGVIGLVGNILLRGEWGTAPQKAGLALILGGALGNLIDRLHSEGVLDFADFYLGEYHWPAFNVADSCIVIGAGMVIVGILREKPAAEHK